MPLSVPELTITKKQLFSDNVELQVYDNKLYITRKVNGVIEGGTIVLDPLPPEATLGAFGNVTATSAVTGEYTLAVNSEDYTEAEMDDLAIQLQAELEAQFPGTTISVTVVAGSLKAQYTIVPSDIDTWDMTAAAASLDTNKKTLLQSAAASAGLTQLASDIENDVVVPSATVLPTLAAQVLPGIVKSVSLDDGTLTIETLGAFTTMKYSVDGGVSWSDITPAASGNSHTLALAGSVPGVIRIRLLNAAGSKIAQMVAQIIPPLVASVFWPLRGDTMSTGQTSGVDFLIGFLDGRGANDRQNGSSYGYGVTSIDASDWIASGKDGSLALNANLGIKMGASQAGEYYGAGKFENVQWSALTFSYDFYKLEQGPASPGDVTYGFFNVEVYLQNLVRSAHPSIEYYTKAWGAANLFQTTPLQVNDVFSTFYALSIEEWHQMTITISAPSETGTVSSFTLKYYFDGVYAGEETISKSASLPRQDLYVSWRSFGEREDGNYPALYQDFSMFYKALSDAEVATWYTQTR